FPERTTSVRCSSCRAHTGGIANKGFSGMRKVVARFNFSCNLTGNRPQSLTAYSLNRPSRIAKKHLRKSFPFPGNNVT
ncbi:MAG TPA: hypothetical protein PLV51_10375, partial [Lentimicrobium sp.]|nr:hypothetical protein [Lentimicrobium sp.]